MHPAHHATFAFLDTLSFRRVKPQSILLCRMEYIATMKSCRQLHGHQILTLFVCNSWVSTQTPIPHTPVNAVVGSETESVWGTGVGLE